jgi:ubiquinone/menaquinone biosynthesis C-methylase UbiE
MELTSKFGGQVMDTSQYKEQVQAQFSRTAEAYVRSEGHAKVNEALIDEWISPQADWVALDVATGGGHVARALSKRVHLVYATDITRPMLEAARNYLVHELQLSNIMFVLADAECLPFLDDTFDLVTCRIAAHHFPEPQRFIQEAYRVLKPGGSFLLIDNVAPDNPQSAEFLNTFEKMRDPSHVRCLSTVEWSQLMEGAGFTIRNARLQRKKVRFKPWLMRTVSDAAQASAVETFIRNGPKECQECFSVAITDGQIESLEIDEWSVHCVK